MLKRPRLSKALITLAAATASLAPAAVAETAPAAPGAAPGATAAPGGPIAVLFEGDPSFGDTARCSQGPVGTVRTPDGQVRTVMVTAGHCFEVKGETVRLEAFAPVRQGAEVAYPRVGVIDAQRPPFEPHGDLMDFYRIIDEPDWAVVRLDDPAAASTLSTSRDERGRGPSPTVAITGVRDYRNLRGDELISFDNLGQPICKDGIRTGRSCGVQVFRTQHFLWHLGLNFESGDSGGINYDPNNGEALGLSVIGFGPLGNSQQVDRALEDAYGIPDGQVPAAFTPAPPAERADFASLREEIAYYRPPAQPAPAPTPAPTPKQRLGEAVGAAHDDAARFAAQAQQLPTAADPVAAAGDLAGQASAAAQHHARQIGSAIAAMVP